MTAYLAGRGGLSLLRLQTIILTFSSPKNLKRYTKIESFQSSRIRRRASTFA